jgi:hypothetical protein
VSDNRGVQGPVGSWEIAATHDAIKSFELFPVIITFRAIDPAMCAYPISDVKPSGTTLPIDGKLCQEYTMRFSADSIVHFWLDPARDFVVCRVCRVRQERLTAQYDIQYEPNEICGWIPVSWARNYYRPNGEIISATSVQVLHTQLNHSQPAEQFDVTFPPGTIAIDAKKGTMYRVQADGSMRELNAKGEEIAEPIAQPGIAGTIAQPGQQRYHWYERILVGFAAAISILILAYWLRRTWRIVA